MKEAVATESVEYKNIFYLATKRLIDIIGGLVGVLLLLPIMLCIKIASMLNGDFGKIMFTQNRIGKNGKEFKFYKFRSMVPNADEEIKN